MEIYLVRHSAPAVSKGVCYGQADLDVTSSFLTEAAIIREHIPADVTAVYSSPLQRCKRLAEHLFPGHAIQLWDDLREINCGKWEMQPWNDIARHEIDPWMEDLINVCIPGGESYRGVFERVKQCFNKIIGGHDKAENIGATAGNPAGRQRAVIIAHGGVIRSIMSYITDTPLADSFRAFSLHYSCVIRLVHDCDGFRYEILSNIATEKETHKPSRL